MSAQVASRFPRNIFRDERKDIQDADSEQWYFEVLMRAIAATRAPLLGKGRRDAPLKSSKPFGIAQLKLRAPRRPAQPRARAAPLQHPFSVLPNEILAQIFEYLWFPDVFSLALSSSHLANRIALSVQKAQFVRALSSILETPSSLLGLSLLQQLPVRTHPTECWCSYILCEACLYVLPCDYFDKRILPSALTPPVCRDCKEFRSGMEQARAVAEMGGEVEWPQMTWRPHERVHVGEGIWYRFRDGDAGGDVGRLGRHLLV